MLLVCNLACTKQAEQTTAFFAVILTREIPWRSSQPALLPLKVNLL